MISVWISFSSSSRVKLNGQNLNAKCKKDVLGRKEKKREGGGGLQDCCRVHVRLPVRGLSLVTSVRKMSRLSRHLLLWVVGVADGELVIALTVSSLLSPPTPPLQSLPVPSELQRFPPECVFSVVEKTCFCCHNGGECAGFTRGQRTRVNRHLTLRPIRAAC